MLCLCWSFNPSAMENLCQLSVLSNCKYYLIVSSVSSIPYAQTTNSPFKMMLTANTNTVHDLHIDYTSISDIPHQVPNCRINVPYRAGHYQSFYIDILNGVNEINGIHDDQKAWLRIDYLQRNMSQQDFQTYNYYATFRPISLWQTC